jgi:hypothetical protein
MGQVSKRDLVKMSHEQVNAGRSMWQRTGQVGRLTHHSFNAEEMAPKTWISCVNNKGEEQCIIECELYVQARHSDRSEGVAMLHGTCPICSETFIVREDNKEMSVEYVPYRQAPRFLRQQFSEHVLKRGRRVSEEMKIPVVSSAEPWLCDYCHSWGVRVQAGVAVPDMTRVRRVNIDMSTGHGVPVIDPPTKLDL